MRLLGNIEARTDSKGRVFLPAAFRKVLPVAGETCLVLRRDVFQPCITIYPEAAWNALMDSVRQRIDPWNPRHMQVYRQLLSDVEIVSQDSGGRILMPKRFLESAGISQGIRFIGMGDYIEAWSSEHTKEPFMAQEEFRQELEHLMRTTDDYKVEER